VVAVIIGFAVKVIFYPVAMATSPFFGGWFFFPFGFIFIFFLFFVITRLVFWPWGWRGGWGHRYYGYHHDDAHEILRQRYARGEITKQQFDQMASDLEQHQ